MKQLTIVCALCAFLWGCTKNVDDTQASRFHEDGRAKPIVAVVPVCDRSDSRLTWSLGDEFTHNIHQYLSKRDQFCLRSIDEVHTTMSYLTESQNPFSVDTQWIKQAFEGNEFVVFTEFVEHDVHPKQSQERLIDKITPSSELTMTMRIRIFDLRSGTPKIVLQELVQEDYLIPKPSIEHISNPEHWKRITFKASPLGLAHSALIKEVGRRIESYVLLSQSR